MTVSYRAISFSPSSNKAPPSPPYCVGSKIKSLPEEIYNEELPAGIGDYSSCSPFVIGGNLNMGDMIGGNFSLNNHTIYQ